MSSQPEPDHSPQLSSEELEFARDSLTARPRWLDLARTIEAHAMESGSEPLGLLGLAFVYDLIAGADSERRHTAGSPYASMIETETGAYPPRPADLEPEVKAVWRQAAEKIDDPIVSARVNDLIYVAEGPAAYAAGLAGAAAHSSLTEEGSWSALERAEVMARALEVYAELNDKPAVASTAEKASGLVDELLEQDHPGPPFIAVRALIALKPERRPAGLDDLLDRVVARFDSGHAAETALDLAAQATTDESRRQDLRRRQLQVLIGVADSAEGLGEVTFLQRAIEFARRHGFSEEAQVLLKRQQDLPHESLAFKSFETEVELPREEIDAQIDRYAGAGAKDVLDALNRIGQLGPHGGSNADLDREVEQQNQEFPLLGLVGHQLFESGSSTPTFLANDAESKRLLARGRQRQLHAEFYGRFLIGPMLIRAVDAHDRPSHDELAEHFSTELVGPDRGERFARALELFWDGEYDDAAHVIVPRLESTLRDIARAAGLGIVKPADPARYGGIVSLNHVMDKLRELEDASPWLDYLQALLCDPLALNLRNLIAHGLVPRAGPVDAALLVQAGCHLALLRRLPD